MLAMTSSQSGQLAQAHRYREQAHSYSEFLPFQLIQPPQYPGYSRGFSSKSGAIPFATSRFTLTDGATAAGSLVKRIIPLADLAGE